MTATVPGLTFLSWSRTGLASAVTPPVGGNPLDAAMPLNATLAVALKLGTAGEGAYSATVAGPGDAVGLDVRQVIRTDPADGETGVFPNYFPLIEFDRPDLPWLLTPNAPARSGITDADPRRGLRPWLVLVVVEDRPLMPPSASRALSLLDAGTDELPDLNEAWLWAHAQVLTTGIADKTLERLLADPAAAPRTLSRLVAATRQRPGTDYLACVVPAYEAGRRAGLGLDPDASAHVLDEAWSTAGPARQVALPVYYSWRFTTGAIGDFEYLARLLTAAPLGDAGIRPMDIGTAGTGIPAPGPGEPPWVLDYEGVLIGGKVQPGKWAPPREADVRAAIAARLAPGAKVLSPPTYGSLQGGYAGDLISGHGPQWLRELNTDPRYRVLAALGTQTVVHHAEALADSAWAQTAQMREANRLLRQAQLARALGEVLDRRRVSGDASAPALPPDRLLQLTAQVHSQVAGPAAGTSRTIAGALAPNSAVTAALSVPFRRIARPTGPLRRRVADPVPPPVSRLAQAPDAATRLTPAPPFTDVGGMRLLQQAGTTTLRELGPQRVAAPVFPWEAPAIAGGFAAPASTAPNGAAPASGAPSPAPAAAQLPHTIPYGWHSDILLTTFRRPLMSYGASRWTASLGRSLDFDGIPERGWEELRLPPASGIGFSSWQEPYASTYIDLPGFTGLLDIGVGWTSGGGASSSIYLGRVGWTPGYLLESTGRRVMMDTVVTVARKMQGLAIAASDFTGTGRIDVIVVWSDADEATGGTATRYRIGRDLDANGVIHGGWSALMYAGFDAGPYSAAAAGPNLFLLRHTDLEVNVVGPNGSFSGGASVDLRAYLPEDTCGGAIAAADFGGGTNSDLLVFYCAGSGTALRLGCRVAYDVRGDGTIGGWGPHLPVPVGVAGTEIGVLVGAMTAATADTRRELTAAFRGAAVLTQQRQQRVLPAAPEAPDPAVPTTAATEAVRTGLNPAKAVRDATLARLSLGMPLPASGLTDPLQPLALTPRFPYPTFELFRDGFPDRVMPGASGFPDNAASALRVNRLAVESYLVGLNAEMSRELLWRGFPVHHGTFFREFWRASAPDVTDIASWGNTALGAHAPAGPQASLLLVVRAELLRRIPDVMVYAAPSKAAGGGRSVNLDARKDPLFGGTLAGGLIYYAFDLNPEAAVGTGPTDGWYFVFQQHPTAPRFGLDEPPAGGAYGTVPPNWENVDWAGVVADETAFDRLGYLPVASSPLAGHELPDSGRTGALTHRWGFSAAHMAHITLQRPVQIALPAARLLDLGTLS